MNAYFKKPILSFLLGSVFLFGCAKLSPDQATSMTSKELCKIYTGTLVPPKDRRTAYAQIEYRGILCRPDAYDQRLQQQRNLNRAPRRDF